MRVAQSFFIRFSKSFIGFFLLCFSIAFLIMARREFDEVNINQILFHMQLMRDNIVTMPGDFIDVFLWHMRNAFLAAVTLAYLRESGMGKEKRSSVADMMVCIVLAALWVIVPGRFIDDIFEVVQASFLFILGCTALCALGKGRRWYRKAHESFRKLSSGWRIGMVWAGVALYSMGYVNLFTYFQEQTAAGDFYTEGSYVDPRDVTVSGSGNKNLLIIYCESIEEAFGRQEIMGRDLLEPIRPFIDTPELHIEQMPGADFTIGGIVSSQCGIPLKSISILSGNLTGWALERFLPGAVCLGDYLKADGYHNVYYNGSSGVFSGLDKFFLSHGYQEFMGKEDWLKAGKITETDLNMWALYDQDIVDLSIARLEELMAVGRKFSFAISTMDTHEPGFLSPDCTRKGMEEAWPGYIRCSMSQVGRLLAHVRDKGWEERFVILVMGDHRARMNTVGDVDLKRAEPRYVLCSLDTQGRLLPMRSVINHFDLFPTLLAALGFSIEGDRLGFGYNVFSREVLPPLNNHEELKKRVLSGSKVYESLWLPEYAEGKNAQR